MDAPTGTYLHLQRLSTEDGPGIRTTVFMKGCLLRCQWCHNPESLITKPQVQRVESNCIRCASCIEVCPQGCLKPGGDFVEIDQHACDTCGQCVQECPAGALEYLGIQVTVEALYAELIKDHSFFNSSGGGVTLSGGEPALQADFCSALMSRLQADGIHTALDTCGMTSQRNLHKILPHSDLILYDLKEIDPQRHKAFTGQSNEVILRNLLVIRDFLSQGVTAPQLWIRTPLIPGATATEENLIGIGAFLAGEVGDLVDRWELCAFNNLCGEKYQRLGMTWDYADTPLLTSEELDQMEFWAKESGFSPDRILATGAVQVPC
jgi:pyruvate formate lyase activating enzyme